MSQRNKGILARMRNFRVRKRKNKWHDASDVLPSSSEEAEITESGKRKHAKGDHQHPCKHPRLPADEPSSSSSSLGSGRPDWHMDINESDEADYFVDALEEQPSTKGTTRFSFARIFQKNRSHDMLSQTRKEHRDMDSGYVGFQSAVRVSHRRPIRVTLMTSSYLSTIDALKQKLERYQSRHGDVIKSVQILELPYSGLSYYKFPDETQIDVMVLCHSINNRRFNITDVTDSLYDEFLAYCKGAIGKQNIVVIAHDFPPQSKEIREVTMRGFRSSQPTTFEMAGLAMVCGQMEHTLDMSQEDWDSLVKILEDSPKRVTHAGPASRRGVEQPPFMNIAHDDCMMMEEQSRDESAVLASSWSWWWPRRWWAPILRWWRSTSENQELGGRSDGEISSAPTSAHDHSYNGNTTPDDDSYDQYFDATNREPRRDVSKDNEVCMNDESRRWWPRRWWLMWWGSTSENQELGGRTDGEISGAATSAHGHGYNDNTTPDDSSCDQDFDATNREPGSDERVGLL